MTGDMTVPQRLDYGLETISRWRTADDVHLPAEGKSAPRFHPRDADLEEILRRPSLDERLTSLLQPLHLAPDLLEPSILAQTREETLELLRSEAHDASGHRRVVLTDAADLLAGEVQLDQMVRASLSALLRG